MDSQNTVKFPVKYHTKNVTTDVISNQPIVCTSDQQASHVTCRQQGLSQQLSNLQIRRTLKRNTLINGGNVQKIVVNLLQQLVTECTDWVPATQPCTVALTTGYSVPTGYQLHRLVQLLQQLVTESTGYRVYRPATQPTLNSLLHISRLQSLPAYYQPAPRITNPKVFYQLATPHQQPVHRPKTDDRPNNVNNSFSYTETASTGHRAHQPVTGYTVFTEQFCFTLASYRDYQPAIRCNYCLPPFQYWSQNTGSDQQAHLGIT